MVARLNIELSALLDPWRALAAAGLIGWCAVREFLAPIKVLV